MNSMQPSHSRVVLVTGASTGIGLSLIRQLIEAGFRTVATARESSLPRFASEGIVPGERLLIYPLDVTVPAQQETVVQQVYDQWGRIDVLVNNAGVSYRSVTEHVDPQSEQEQFAINYFGPMQLTRLVLPRMRELRGGHIINVSSVGGMMAMPTMGIYSAAKFALEGASEALWYEARPWGIRVSLIEPGFINSDGFRKVFFTKPSQQAVQDSSNDYYAYYHHMSRFIEQMMTHSLSRSENVASTILRVMNQECPRLRVPATLDAWFFYFLRRLIPRHWYHAILYRSLPHLKKWVPDAKN